LDVGFRPSPNPNELFVVERLVKGESLTEQMESHPRAYANATAFFQRARQLACSLRQLHQHMIVHGDIWPDNIMVEKEGSGRTRAVLIDLGEST
jgi:serine/threonine protein kinase